MHPDLYINFKDIKVATGLSKILGTTGTTIIISAIEEIYLPCLSCFKAGNNCFLQEFSILFFLTICDTYIVSFDLYCEKT